MADIVARYSPGTGLLVRRPGWLAYAVEQDRELIELLHTAKPETLFRSLARFIVNRDFKGGALVAVTESPRRVLVFGELDLSTTEGADLADPVASTWTESALSDHASLKCGNNPSAAIFELNDGTVPAGSFILEPVANSTAPGTISLPPAAETHRGGDGPLDADDTDPQPATDSTLAGPDSTQPDPPLVDEPPVWDPLADPVGLDLERLGDPLPTDDTVTAVGSGRRPGTVKNPEPAPAAAPDAPLVPEPGATPPAPSDTEPAPAAVPTAPVDETPRHPPPGLRPPPYTDPTLLPPPAPNTQAPLPPPPPPPLDDAPAQVGPAAGSAVMAVPCTDGHANPPGTTRCRRCGGTVMIGASPQPMPRGSLGRLVFDDGQRFELESNAAVGRNPAKGGLPDGVTSIVIRGGQVSRRHFTIELVEWSVRITDCGAMNGTETQPGGAGGRTRIPERGSVEIEPGCVVHFGDRFVTYEAG